MKVIGAGSGRQRRYDLVGEIVSVGEKYTVGQGDEAQELNALKVKALFGPLKDQEVLMVIDPEVKSENANRITVKGLKSANGNIAGAGSVIHFQNTNFVSSKDDEQKALQARWSYKMGGSDTVKVEPHQAALLSFPGQDRQNFFLTRPGDGAVSRETDAAGLTAAVMDVYSKNEAKADNEKESTLFLASLNDEEAMNLAVISLLKREGSGDNVTYERRTEDEVKALVGQRINDFDPDAEVAIIPGSRAYLSKQAGKREVDGKTVDIKYASGFSTSNVMLSNGTWEDDDGKKGEVVNRVEEAALRLAGFHQDDDIPDTLSFSRMKGQIEGYAPSEAEQAQEEKVAEAAAEATPEPDVNPEDVFGDLPESEEESGISPR
jgi:hypothetical protein